MRYAIFVATLVLLGTILFRPISGSAAGYYGHTCADERVLTASQIIRGKQEVLTPSEYLDAVDTITGHATENLAGQTDLVNDLEDDYSLLFDADWAEEMSNCLESQDAYYTQIAALYVPYQFVDYHDELQWAYYYVILADDELRQYLVDHDLDHVDQAGTYYTLGTARLEKATDLLERTGYSL